MHQLRRLFIGSLLILLPTSAFALEMPVSYWVDSKVLKKEAPTGTMLTFELFTDSACTVSIHSEVIDITQLSFSIEGLKLAKVKGALKAPKPARLNAVLSGVTPGAETYLKVTGTGINAINGDCQLQVSGIEGLPGADGSAIVANFACGAGEAVTGFDAGGLPICASQTSTPRVVRTDDPGPGCPSVLAGEQGTLVTIISQAINLANSGDVAIVADASHNLLASYVTYRLVVDGSIRAHSIVQMPPTGEQWTGGVVHWGGNLAAGPHTIELRANWIGTPPSSGAGYGCGGNFGGITTTIFE